MPPLTRPSFHSCSALTGRTWILTHHRGLADCRCLALYAWTCSEHLVSPYRNPHTLAPCWETPCWACSAEMCEFTPGSRSPLIQSRVMTKPMSQHYKSLQMTPVSPLIFCRYLASSHPAFPRQLLFPLCKVPHTQSFSNAPTHRTSLPYTCSHCKEEGQWLCCCWTRPGYALPAALPAPTLCLPCREDIFECSVVQKDLSQLGHQSCQQASCGSTELISGSHRHSHRHPNSCAGRSWSNGPGWKRDAQQQGLTQLTKRQYPL